MYGRCFYMNEKGNFKYKIFVLSIVTCIIIAFVVIGVISSSFISKGTYSASVIDDGGGGGSGNEEYCGIHNNKNGQCSQSCEGTKKINFKVDSNNIATVNCRVFHYCNIETTNFTHQLACPGEYSNNYISVPKNPTKEGYEFTGWGTYSGCVNGISSGGSIALTATEKEVTYYACWKKKECKYVYADNDTPTVVKLKPNYSICECPTGFTKNSSNNCQLKSEYFKALGNNSYSYNYSVIPSGLGCKTGYKLYSNLCVYCNGDTTYSISKGKCISSSEIEYACYCCGSQGCSYQWKSVDGNNSGCSKTTKTQAECKGTNTSVGDTSNQA